ncbi:MAG: hypothetical protein JNJ88_21650 [Planctomycetes bacterium]|nr:hypothetical protein [Planctomycetota bacterium]
MTRIAISDLPKILPGLILRVPNRWWRFDDRVTSEHPGACIRVLQLAPGPGHAVLSKGSSKRDRRSVTYVERSGRLHLVVAPDSVNGLRDVTHFQIAPRVHYFSADKIGRLSLDRTVGRLSEADFAEMRRLFDVAFPSPHQR